MPGRFFRHYLPGPGRLREHRSLRLGLGGLLWRMHVIRGLLHRRRRPRDDRARG